MTVIRGPESSLDHGGVDLYDEKKRHAIRVLHDAGLSLRQVAKKAKVDRNTVRRVLGEGFTATEPDFDVGVRSSVRVRRATMETSNDPSYTVSRSGRQGVGGNPESEGTDPQARGPKEDEPTTSLLAEGRPCSDGGKSCVAYGEGVCEVGRRVWGLHGDLGKPSVLPTVARKEASGLGPRWRMARATGRVDLVATRGRRDQGGRGSRSSRDVRGNSERAKGSRSAKGGAEKTGGVTSRGRARNGGTTHPILYGEPPREGKGAERPPSRSSAIGENHP